MSAKPTALVAVSHSDLVARGVVEIARQMAADVHLAAAGGAEEGRIGTSFDTVDAAVMQALAVDGVTGVVLVGDLGSAVMTAESVVDMSEGDVAFASGPLVEGFVAGAVRAQQGGTVEEVAAQVRSVTGGDVESETRQAPSPSGDGMSREVEVRNPQGLHARPAALLAQKAAEYDATVTVDGADATSLLELMSLGTEQGAVVTVRTSGPQAREALDGVVGAIESGLGEL